jgi:NADPH:quinone reductase-like Zn-dependent oxidoreductase
MLAVEISRHGGPEELVVVERPEPVAAAGQVVVRNSWIGVNYVDLQHRAGQPYPVGLPLIPGTEAAGTVVAVGAGGGAPSLLPPPPPTPGWSAPRWFTSVTWPASMPR